MDESKLERIVVKLLLPSSYQRNGNYLCIYSKTFHASIKLSLIDNFVILQKGLFQIFAGFRGGVLQRNQWEILAFALRKMKREKT